MIPQQSINVMSDLLWLSAILETSDVKSAFLQVHDLDRDVHIQLPARGEYFTAK